MQKKFMFWFILFFGTLPSIAYSQGDESTASSSSKSSRCYCKKTSSNKELFYWTNADYAFHEQQKAENISTDASSVDEFYDENFEISPCSTAPITPSSPSFPDQPKPFPAHKTLSVAMASRTLSKTNGDKFSEKEREHSGKRSSTEAPEKPLKKKYLASIPHKD